MPARELRSLLNHWQRLQRDGRTPFKFHQYLNMCNKFTPAVYHHNSTSQNHEQTSKTKADVKGKGKARAREEDDDTDSTESEEDEGDEGDEKFVDAREHSDVMGDGHGRGDEGEEKKEEDFSEQLKNVESDDESSHSTDESVNPPKRGDKSKEELEGAGSSSPAIAERDVQRRSEILTALCSDRAFQEVMEFYKSLPVSSFIILGDSPCSLLEK